MSVTTRPAALLFAAAALFASSAAAQDCKLTEMSSLPMSFDGDGSLLVPVSIDGTAHKMAVVPGASFGAVTQTLVDALSLKAQPITRTRGIYFGGDERPKTFVTIPSLKLGMEEATYTAFVVDPTITSDDPALAGVIGADILKHFDLDFDFAAGKFNLFSPDHCEGKVVYWSPAAYVEAPMQTTATGSIGVTMTLDGHDVAATLDAGSTGTQMTLREAAAVFGIDEHSPNVETFTKNGRTGYRAHFKSLSISGITVLNPEIYLVEDKLGEQVRKELEDEKLNGYQGNSGLITPHLVVGLNVLRHLHLYVAYKEHKIYATAADAHDGAPPPPH
jgi:Aspartyl protease